jgi:DNA-binding beta-propeller fold protein YncE
MTRTLPILRSVLFLAAAIASSACSDSTGPVEPLRTEVGVVLGSVDLSLTVFEVDAPTQLRTVGLGAAGSPVSLAVRGDLAAVPMGVVPALVVVDLRTATVLRTISLPAGSGATGADFLNDSIVIVANPELNSVSPVNVLRGTVAPPIPVGRYPQAVRVHAGRVWVVNAELVQFVPSGPGTLTALDAATLAPLGTVTLSGENPGSIAVASDGRLFVLHSGRFGAASGSLSVVDPVARREVSHHTGFGDFPGALAVSPSGALHVSAFSFGLATWNPATSAWTRAPGAPAPSPRLASSSGVGVDSAGRLYTLFPDCGKPAAALRLDAALAVQAEIPVGICPVAIAFSEVSGG